MLVWEGVVQVGSTASLEGAGLEERTVGDEIVLCQMPSTEQGVVLCWDLWAVLCWDPWVRKRVEL